MQVLHIHKNQGQGYVEAGHVLLCQAQCCAGDQHDQSKQGCAYMRASLSITTILYTKSTPKQLDGGCMFGMCWTNASPQLCPAQEGFTGMGPKKRL